jgi:hypothetical protein
MYYSCQLRKGNTQIAKHPLTKPPFVNSRKDNLGMLRTTGMNLGTMCSGTDVGADAVGVLLRVASSELGVEEVRFRHRFSCEIVPYKQRFIMEFSNPEMVFPDVTRLTDSACHDVRSGSRRAVPPSTMVMAGFSCTDVSHMNINSTSARSCVIDRSMRTGSTMYGIEQYVSQFQPPFVVLENVAAIADTNADGPTNAATVIERLRAKGYVGCTMLLSPMKHGVPHRRRRMWFVFIKVCSGPLRTMEVEAWMPVMEKMREMVMKTLEFNTVPLGKVLMAESSADLAEWSARVEAARAGADAAEPWWVDPAGPGGKKLGWVEQHQQTFRAAAVLWPPCFELRYAAEAYARLMTLPRRPRECIFYADETGPDLGDPDDEEVIDVQQGIGRFPRCLRGSPCILPNAILWLRKRSRRMFPNECLHLQSLPLRTRAQYANYSNAELMSLAGNAFCGHNVMAILVALLSTYRWPLHVE